MDSRQLCGIYVRSCYLGNSIRGDECHYRVCFLSDLSFALDSARSRGLVVQEEDYGIVTVQIHSS